MERTGLFYGPFIGGASVPLRHKTAARKGWQRPEDPEAVHPTRKRKVSGGSQLPLGLCLESRLQWLWVI